jgi:hypothetical protein
MVLFTRRNKAGTLKQRNTNQEKLQTWYTRTETRAMFLAPVLPPSKKKPSSSGSLPSSTGGNSETSFQPEEVNTRQTIVRFEKTGHATQEFLPFTPEESSAYWYNPSELKTMKHEARLLAELHADNTWLINENECPQRGLEFYIELAAGKSAQKSRQAVLKMQKQSKKKTRRGKKFLEKKNKPSPAELQQSRLQKVYYSYTQGSCIQARFLALSDEVAVLSDRS